MNCFLSLHINFHLFFSDPHFSVVYNCNRFAFLLNYTVRSLSIFFIFHLPFRSFLLLPLFSPGFRNSFRLIFFLLFLFIHIPFPSLSLYFFFIFSNPIFPLLSIPYSFSLFLSLLPPPLFESYLSSFLHPTRAFLPSLFGWELTCSQGNRIIGVSPEKISSLTVCLMLPDPQWKSLLDNKNDHKNLHRDPG